MEKYKKRLDEEQWGELYNKEQVINGILTEQVFCWTEELLKISAEGDKMCEVGCGSGQSAAYLQRHGRKVTALDFSKECVELVNVINSHLNLGMNVVCADMRQSRFRLRKKNLTIFISADFWSISIQMRELIC